MPLLLQWELQNEAFLKDNLNVVFLFYFPINDDLEEDFSAEAKNEEQIIFILYVMYMLVMCLGRTWSF